MSSTSSSPSGKYTLDESDIAWTSDEDMFKQPTDFKFRSVAHSNVTCTESGLPSSCKHYCSNGQCYNFYYPDDDSTQYLYETYPDQISPIDGVTDQHFKVWMNTAALPKFRKLYGKIEGPFNKGDVLIFNVVANYEVASYKSKKSLVISTQTSLGGRNPYLGIAYIVVGSICLFFGALFSLKQIFLPRPLGDPSLIP